MSRSLANDAVAVAAAVVVAAVRPEPATVPPTTRSFPALTEFSVTWSAVTEAYTPVSPILALIAVASVLAISSPLVLDFLDDVTWKAGATGKEIADTLSAAINSRMGETGLSASVTSGGAIKLESLKAGKDLTVTAGTITGGQGTTGTPVAATAAQIGVDFTAGTAASQTAVVVSKLDISTVKGAQQALDVVDEALKSVNSARADLGAVQNRFTSVVANLQTSSENLAASRSRIRDTDFAKETAELTRSQILQQAGTAMLAQANQVPQNVMSLLR